MDFGAFAGKHRPVAILQIADRLGEGRERDGIGAEIHFALAVADGERRAFARADHQIVLADKQEGERESAAQLLKRGRHRLDRRLAVLHLLGDEMGDDFGIGLAAELGAVLDQRFAQLTKVLDDAVMHDGDAVGGVGMRIALGRPAVRRPARVANADIAGQRLVSEPGDKRLQFALGAAAAELAVIERGDAGGVVAAVFEALERIDQMAGDRFAPENSDDPAHPFGWPLF